MVIRFRTSWTGPVASIVVANLLGLSFSANVALADDTALRQAREIGLNPIETSSKRSRSAKVPTQKQPAKSDRSGNFIYEMISNIRTQSEELCARYGNPNDCLEEAEVCLTMRDDEESVVRLCVNTVPGDGDKKETGVQKSRLRQ